MVAVRRGDAAVPESADIAGAARSICLRLLTARPRSRAELATALARKGVPDDVAERVLDRLTEVGLVDDVMVAEMVVRSGRRYRSLGRRAISAELRRRGIDRAEAEEAVAAIDAESEEATARALVARKLRTGAGPGAAGADEAARVRRLVAMLARKGYSEGLAYRVVREALRAEGSDIELPDPEHS